MNAIMPAPYRLTHEDAVATLTFTRTERHNAFDLATIREWRDVVETTLADAKVRALLITGEGRAFCAGADVKEMAEVGARKEHFRHLTEQHHALVRMLRLSEKPIVTAANGAIAGGGCGIFLAGDYRFAAESASMKPAFLSLGVSPDGGITHLLPRFVGIARAQEILYADRKMESTELDTLGLVHEVVPDNDLLARARDRARALADAPPFAIASIKSLLQMTFDNPLSMQLAEERNLNGKSAETPEFKERLAAFLAQKRA